MKDISELADLIEKRGHDITDTLFAKNCGFNNGEAIAGEIRDGNMAENDLDNVQSYLSVDGKVVGLNRFVSDYLKQNIIGVVSTLNLGDFGVEDIGKIEVVIPNENSKHESSQANVEISINKKPLEINGFTRNIIANSIKAMIESIKTEENVERIDIEIYDIAGEDLTDCEIILKTNGNDVELNEFASGILKQTIYGIVSSLKIDGEIGEIQITVED